MDNSCTAVDIFFSKQKLNTRGLLPSTSWARMKLQCPKTSGVPFHLLQSVALIQCPKTGGVPFYLLQSVALIQCPKTGVPCSLLQSGALIQCPKTGVLFYVLQSVALIQCPKTGVPFFLAECSFNSVPQDWRTILSCRVFQRIATLGLYLFNDALVITKRTSKHFPFSRAIEYTYKFETSLALTSMQVVDMPDSKCECFLFSLLWLQAALIFVLI